MCSRTSAMLRRSGPAAPSFLCTFSHACRRLLSSAMLSILIGGRSSFVVHLGFGTARGAGEDRSSAAPATSPFGLSVVPKCSSSCPADSLTVVAFPPRLTTAVRAVFRLPFGTTRPSDFSRPFVILFFRPRWLPLASTARCGGREISPGKVRVPSCHRRRLYTQRSNGNRASPSLGGLPALRPS